MSYSHKELPIDVLIVGAGPTGIACGIAAKKFGLSCVLLEKGVLVNSIYNFPDNMTFFSTSVNLEIGRIPFISHHDKPTRTEALEYYRRVALHHQLQISYNARVDSVEKINDIWLVYTDGKTYKAKNVILATGFYDCPNLLKIPGENLPKVKHYYDDAHLYIGQKVVVVGGANSACDVALETWQKGADVTMIVRESKLYQKVKYWILPNIENRIKEGSIKAYFNAELLAINAHEVDIKVQQSRMSIPNDYVLAMTGYRPDYDLMARCGVTLTTDEYQTPIYDNDTFETPQQGLFLAGVLQGGLHTSKLFIENTRDHGRIICNEIYRRIQVE